MYYYYFFSVVILCNFISFYLVPLLFVVFAVHTLYVASLQLILSLAFRLIHIHVSLKDSHRLAMSFKRARYDWTGTQALLHTYTQHLTRSLPLHVYWTATKYKKKLKQNNKNKTEKKHWESAENANKRTNRRKKVVSWERSGNRYKQRYSMRTYACEW